VAGRIPTLTNGEVGRGRQLGQHGEVVDSIEASRGGGGSGSPERALCGGSAEERTGAGPEERWVAPVLGRRSGGTGAHGSRAASPRRERDDGGFEQGRRGGCWRRDEETTTVAAGLGSTARGQRH
jgi:hypothetical protein